MGLKYITEDGKEISLEAIMKQNRDLQLLIIGLMVILIVSFFGVVIYLDSSNYITYLANLITQRCIP